jgi:hypothetical protein
MSNNLNDRLGGLLGVMANLIEPALEFMRTGNLAAAAWTGVGGALRGHLLGPISLASGAAIGLLGVMKKLVLQADLLNQGMSKLRELEMVKTQFQPLLGGAAQAQARLEELYAFAARTPFQLSEIAEASKTLEVLTRGAISTGESLRMVGDAAAVSGQSMQSVAFWTGRLYDGLQAGRPIGEAANRLMEMGLITGQTRAKLEDMNASGVEFNQVWAVATEGMAKTKGGMEQLSKTLGGLESTLVDVRAAFEKSFADAFKEGEMKGVKNSMELLSALEEPVKALGKHFSNVSNTMASVSGFFIKLGKDSKILSSGLHLVVDALFAIGGGLIVGQIFHTTRAFFQLAGVVRATAASHDMSAVAAAWNSNAHAGLWARITATSAAMAGMSLQGRISTVTMIAATGAARGLGAALLWVRGAIAAVARSLGVFGWAAIIISALVVAFQRVTGEINDHKASLKAASDSYREFKKTLDDAISSMRTFADKQAAIAKVLKEIATTKAGIGATELEIVLKGEGIGGGRRKTLEKQNENLSSLYQDLANLLKVDNSSLEISQAKTRELEAQLEITKAIRDVEFRTMMRDGKEAVQLYAMQTKYKEVEKATKAGRSAIEGEVILDENNKSLLDRSTKIRGVEDEIRTLESELQDAEGKKTGWAGFIWQTVVRNMIYNDRNPNLSPRDKVSDNAAIAQFQRGLTERITKKQLELATLKQDQSDKRNELGLLSEKAVNVITSREFEAGQAFPGSDKLKNQYVAIVNTLQANTDTSLGYTLTEYQKERLQFQAAQFKKQGEQFNQNEKNKMVLLDEMDLGSRNLYRAISLRIIEEKRQAELLDINPLQPGATLKTRQANLDALEKQFSVEEDVQGVQKKKLQKDKMLFENALKQIEESNTAADSSKVGNSTVSMGRDVQMGTFLDLDKKTSSGRTIREVYKNEGEDGKGPVAFLQKKISELDSTLRSIDSEDRMGPLREELKAASKSLEDYKAKIAEDFSILKEAIQVEMTKLDAANLVSGMRASAAKGGNMDFNTQLATRMLVAASEKEDALYLRKKRREFISAGQNKKQVRASMANERDLMRQGAQSKLSQYVDEGTVLGRRSELEFNKRMNYTSATKELRLLDNQSLVIEELAKVTPLLAKIKEGKDRNVFLQSVQEAIQTRSLAAVRDQIPEFRQITDSFRRIGAGGVAASNDPLKLLAERSLEVEKQTNTLLETMLDLMDNGKRDSSWPIK